METEIVDVRHKGQVITVRVPKGTSDEKIKEYLDKNAGQQTQTPGPTSALDALGVYGASTVNSALFGVPEVAARAMGGGPFIDQLRRDYPYASTAGDVTGLIVPGSLLAKGAQKGIGALSSRGIGKADETMSVLRASDDANRAAQATRQAQNPITQTAGRVAKKAAELGSGVVGAQVGYSALGAARSPENPMGGAVANATDFQREAMGLPGTNLVPGLQPTISTLTGFVPNVLGYGGMMATPTVAPVAPTDFDMDRRIREEAYRRSMGQQ
jgi:hypothetical protein